MQQGWHVRPNEALQLTKREYLVGWPLRGPASLSRVSQLNAGVMPTPQPRLREQRQDAMHESDRTMLLAALMAGSECLALVAGVISVLMLGLPLGLFTAGVLVVLAPLVGVTVWRATTSRPPSVRYFVLLVPVWAMMFGTLLLLRAFGGCVAGDAIHPLCGIALVTAALVGAIIGALNGVQAAA